MKNNGQELDRLKVGDFSIFTKTCTETDVMLYAGLSGNMNPYNLNEEYAESLPLGSTVIPATQLQALANGAIYRLLPEGSIQVKGEYNLVKMAPRGETIIARAEIESIDREKRIVAIAWECYNNDKELLIEGKATEQFY